MALIKCEECGQMVSDKASACPHCGCPVKAPMVCPECGETIAEGDIYCQKCGSPLNHNTQPQVEEQYSWEDDEEKPNNTLRWLLGALAALVVLGGAALYAWQSGIFNKPVPLEDTVAVDSTPSMAAPVINLDANGMYTIDNCPTTYEGLEVEPHISGGSLNSIVVKRCGEEMQTINVNSSYFETITNVVHFLDANFDNYVDFMVGSGECEQSSALFLWSPDESKFVQALSDGGLSFTGGSSYSFRFHPQSQKVYRGGYGDMDVQYLMSWVGNDLRNDEEFIQAFSPSMYYDNVNHRYTILDSKTQKVLFSSDDSKQIPERWKKMARVLTPEEEAEFANYETELLDEGTPDYDSDIEEVKSWINGNWRCRSGSMIVDVAIGENMAVLWNGELYYRGPYSIEGNEIIFNRHNGSSDYIIIDKEHKRLKLSENEPMIRM